MRKSGQTQVLMPMNDRVTDAIAAAAVISPWWLPFIAHISEVASIVTPIFGLIWLLVQIGGKLADWHGKYMTWRIQRRHAKMSRENMERQRQYDRDTAYRPPLAGQSSGIPGDAGDSGPQG